MKNVTEGVQDLMRAQNSSVGMAIRGHKLRVRSEEAKDLIRRALLEAMAESYLAAGLALEHRLAGSIETALRLEQMADDRLAMARRYFCGKV